MTRPDSILIIPATAVVLGLGMILAQSCGPRGSSDAGYHRNYELIGKHVGVTCESCHPPEVGLVAVSKACESCHEPDRPADHYGGGCADCHTELGWGEAVTDHSFFPLADSHALECASCHVDWAIELNSACSSCHEAARPDDHFDTLDCAGCHKPTRWSDAEIDHGFFPLAGPHDRSCTTCHTEEGVFTGLDKACASCHETHRPTDHFVGQDCRECHPTTRWEDGEFDHSPLFPVPHRDATDCGDCHLAEPSYTTFSCTHCHDHRKSKMDEVHSGEGSDYKWDSLYCLDCHPRGKH